MRQSHLRSNLRNGGHIAYRPTQVAVPEITITLISVQVAGFTIIAAYLAFSVVMLHRRNQLSWESLSSRIDQAWLAPALPSGGSARVAAPGAVRPTRWSAFRSAGVLMQMADYADRNGCAVDPSVLASLRTDAIRVRVAALRARVL